MTYYNLKKLCVIRPVVNRSCDFIRRKNISYVSERDDGSSVALDSRNQKRRKVEHGVTQQRSQKKSSSEADHGQALNGRATKAIIAKQKKASICFEDREKLRKEVCSHLGTSVRGAVSVEVIDIQLSPKRALRAAILKRRFADTIIKAQHKTLFDHGEQADGANIQKEKERLGKKQREEETRTEADKRGAAHGRTAVRLKRQREKEREAARIALQMVEKTVEFDDNIEIMKELEMLLSGFSPSEHESNAESGSENSYCTTFFSPCIGNPLERFGLFLKSEYSGDDEDDEAEDGEIIS